MVKALSGFTCIAVAYVFLSNHHLLSLCEVEPNANEDSGFTNYLRSVLENFQREMKTGIPELKVPPLDPLDLRNDTIDIRTKDGTLDITNLMIYGFPTIEVRDIRTNLSVPEASIKFHVKQLRAEGKYDLNMKLMRIFPLTGNGNFHIEINRLDLYTMVRMASVNLVNLEVTDVDMTIFAGNINVNLENLIDPELSPLLNRILNRYGTLVFNALSPKIEERLEELLKKDLNRKLQNVDITKHLF